VKASGEIAQKYRKSPTKIGKGAFLTATPRFPPLAASRRAGGIRSRASARVAMKEPPSRIVIKAVLRVTYSMWRSGVHEMAHTLWAGGCTCGSNQPDLCLQSCRWRCWISVQKSAKDQAQRKPTGMCNGCNQNVTTFDSSPQQKMIDSIEHIIISRENIVVCRQQAYFFLHHLTEIPEETVLTIRVQSGCRSSDSRSICRPQNE
jgi:hypothetical protein